VILDEAGFWMSNTDFDQTVAFLRKRNLTVVLASYLEPPTRARTFNVQRTLNLDRIFIGRWIYSALVNYMRVKEKYDLVWDNPREVFGLYDTSYIAQDDAGIIDAIKQSMGYLDVHKKNSYHPPSVPLGHGVQSMEEFRRVAQDVSQAASEIAESLSVPSQSRRRRRR
jgi:hypothetical protein